MLLVALFTITKIQKQFKCSSTDGPSAGARRR